MKGKISRAYQVPSYLCSEQTESSKKGLYEAPSMIVVAVKTNSIICLSDQEATGEGFTWDEAITIE